MSQAAKRRVLIIDDDPDIVLVLAALVEDAGYGVVTINHGDYLAHIHTDDLPDLILLDMLLSGQDGRQIARRLKGQEATRHIPIIMLSAHPYAAREALDAGADEFVAKPFEIDALLESITARLADGSSASEPLNNP